MMTATVVICVESKLVIWPISSTIKAEMTVATSKNLITYTRIPVAVSTSNQGGLDAIG